MNNAITNAQKTITSSDKSRIDILAANTDRVKVMKTMFRFS